MYKFKKVKRILAIMLTVVMLAQNCTSVFAAETENTGSNITTENTQISEEASGETDEGTGGGEGDQNDTTDSGKNQADGKDQGDDDSQEGDDTQNGEDDGKGENDGKGQDDEYNEGGQEEPSGGSEAGSNDSENGINISASVIKKLITENSGEVTDTFIEYLVKIENNDAENAAAGITVQAVIPENAELAADKYFTSELSYNEENNKIVYWENQTIPAGAMAEYTLTVKVSEDTDPEAVNTAWTVNGTSLTQKWEDDQQGNDDQEINGDENSDGEEDEEESTEEKIDPETTLTCQGDGFSARLDILDENVVLPEGLTLNVEPVSDAQNEELIEAAKNNGCEGEKGVFYSVDLYSGDQPVSTAENVPAKLQVNFDTPILEEASTVQGVHITDEAVNNADVAVKGGKVRALMVNTRVNALGVLGVVAAGAEDGLVTYESTTTDGIKVQVTMAGVGLPDSENVTVNIEKIDYSEENVRGFLENSHIEVTEKNPIWLNSFYKVTLVDNEGKFIPIKSGTVKFIFSNESTSSQIGVGSSGKDKTAVYTMLCGSDSNISASAPGTDENTIVKSDDQRYINELNFGVDSETEIFGVVAYRRNAININLQEDNQIVATDGDKSTYLQWRPANSSKDTPWNDITSNTPIPKDAEIRVSVCFKVNEPMVYGDILYFDLPEHLVGKEGYTGEYSKRDDNGNIVKLLEYVIGDSEDENGSGKRVTITCTDAFFERDTGIAQDVKGFIQFSGSLTGINNSDKDDTVTISLGSVDLEVTVKKEEKPATNSLTIKKDVEDGLQQKPGIAIFDDMLIYTITVNAPSENELPYENVVVKDSVVSGSEYLSGITEWDGKSKNGSVTEGFEQKSEKGIFYKFFNDSDSDENPAETPTVKPTVTSTLDTNGLPEEFKISSMKPGETVVIKYAVKLDSSIIGLKTSDKNDDLISVNDRKVKNKATVIGENENGKTQAEADSAVSYSQTWLNKEGKVIDVNHIKYKVIANQGTKWNLDGWQFRDTLSEGQKYEEITVSWTDGDGNPQKDTWPSEKSGFSVNDLEDGRQFFTWPAKNGYYEYTFEYTVELNDPDYKENYKNTIELFKESDDDDHHFQTGEEVGYQQYSLDKRKDGSINLSDNTISWKATIKSEYKDNEHGPIPAGSHYEDSIFNATSNSDAGHYMTNKQFDAIEITAYNNSSKSEEKLPAECYKIEATEKTGEIVGFKITFNEVMERTYCASVTIKYKTTAKFSDASDILKTEFRNTGSYVIEPNINFDQQWSYYYKVKSLFNKTAVNDSYTLDPNTNKKTIKWKITVNSNDGNDQDENPNGNLAEGMKNLLIKDVLPSELKCIRIEDVNGKDDVKNKNVEWDGSPTYPQFKIKDCDKKTVEFYIVTEIVDKIDDNGDHRYENTAKLYVGENEKYYGTAKDTFVLDTKLLDKKATAEQDGYLSYTLHINKAREQLVPTVANAELYIIDSMGENLQLLPGSLKVYKDGAPYTGCTIAPYEGDSTKFLIKGIPDASYIRITYMAVAIDPVGPVHAYNKAELFYEDKSKAEIDNEESFEIKESSAGISRGTEVYIRKYDKDNYKPLKDAEFEFGSVEYKDGKFSYTKEKDGLKTNENGQLVLGQDTVGYFLELGKLYYFKEIVPPSGYRGDYTEHVFCVIDKPVSSKVEGVTYLRSETFINIFNEEYKAEVSVPLVGSKKIENGALSQGDFKFYIEAQDGAPLQDMSGTQVSSGRLEVENSSNGNIQFGPIKFKYTDLKGAVEKRFTYKIGEIIPDGAVKDSVTKRFIYNGVIYDDTQYSVTILIKDTGDHKLEVVEFKVNDKPYSDESIVFKNTYASATSFKFAGTKQLDGLDLHDHMFGFKITGDNNIDEVVYNIGEKFEFPTITIKNTDLGEQLSKTFNYKGKPAERRGRKAKGLRSEDYDSRLPH